MKLEFFPMGQSWRDLLPRSEYWNPWWILTLLAAAVGITALVLEALGLFRDLGIVIGGISLFLTIIFGISAATRWGMATLGTGVSQLDRRLSLIDAGITTAATELARMRSDLVAALGRVEALLRSRPLP